MPVDLNNLQAKGSFCGDMLVLPNQACRILEYYLKRGHQVSSGSYLPQKNMLLMGEFQGKIGKVLISVRLSFKLYYYISPTPALNMVMCV